MLLRMSDKKNFDDKRALRVVIRYRVGSRIQKEVAKQGGLDPTTMSQFASGSRFPRPPNMAKLANALDCSVAELKGAIATVLAVAESGGDERAQTRALDLYFMGVKGESDAAKVDRMRDSKLQNLLKNLMKTNSELISYLATQHTSTE